MTVTLHEIERDGNLYLLEWDKEHGYIGITQAADDPDSADEVLETYDFKQTS